jgi:putative redox protein
VGAGGQDSAPGPHDYFDSALATCKAITAMWYAKRHGIPLERVESHVESDGSDERKGVYKIRVRVELFGPMTDDQKAQIQRAIAACPLHKLMTTSDVQIETA